MYHTQCDTKAVHKFKDGEESGGQKRVEAGRGVVLVIQRGADGQTKRALKLLEHVAAVREKALAEDHPSRLSSRHILATVYKADGQNERVLKLLEHVVAVEGKVRTEDHPSLLASQFQLAAVYEADGQIKSALKLLQHVVAVKEKTLASRV